MRNSANTAKYEKDDGIKIRTNTMPKKIGIKHLFWKTLSYENIKFGNIKF